MSPMQQYQDMVLGGTSVNKGLRLRHRAWQSLMATAQVPCFATGFRYHSTSSIPTQLCGGCWCSGLCRGTCQTPGQTLPRCRWAQSDRQRPNHIATAAPACMPWLTCLSAAAAAAAWARLAGSPVVVLPALAHPDVLLTDQWACLHADRGCICPTICWTGPCLPPGGT
jgi:hypothetical protein